MRTPGVFRWALALAACGLAAPAPALELEWEGFSVKLENEYAASAGMRMAPPNLGLIGLGNGGRAYSTNNDDGDQAFRQGDLVSGASRLTSSLTLSYQDFGIHMTGMGLYDPVLDRKDTYFKDVNYGALREVRLRELDRKTAAVRGHVAHSLDLLDGYVFGGFDLLGHHVGFRVGRQSLDWGTTSLLLNGINSVLALDLNRLHLPGVLDGEAVRPVSMVWSSVELIDHLSLEGFYQYDWKGTLQEPAGTFWSTNDFMSIGGTQLNLGFGRVAENLPAGVVSKPSGIGGACLPLVPAGPLEDCIPLGSTIPRLADIEPRPGGNYGGALHFRIPELNDLDLSFFAARYASRLPLLSMVSRALPALLADQADTAGYFVSYPDSIKMYGASFDSSIPFVDVAFQGEYNFKNGQPLQIDDVELLLASLGLPSQINPLAGATLGNQVLQGWRRYDVSQLNFTFTRVFGPRLGYDRFTLFGEAGGTLVHNLPSAGLLRLDAPGTDLPGDLLTAVTENLPHQRTGYPTRESWGYRIAARATYDKLLFKTITLNPTLRFNHDVHGITPGPLNTFIAGRKQATMSLGFGYKSATAEVGYTNFFGGGPANLLADRDFLAVNFKYGF